MTQPANVFVDIELSAQHPSRVENVPELTLDDINAAHYGRLVSIRHCEAEEVRIALITYRNELRAMWRASSDWEAADRVYRSLYRHSARANVKTAIEVAHMRADARHIAADDHRTRMRHFLGL